MRQHRMWAEPELEPVPEQAPEQADLYGNAFAQQRLTELSGTALAYGEPATGGYDPVTRLAPLRLEIFTYLPDPENGRHDRKTVGIGEQVLFDCPEEPGGVWASSGRSGDVTADGQYDWQAPGTPGEYRIVYTAPSGRTGQLEVRVVAPRDITATWMRDRENYDFGEQGVGMELQLAIHPLDVSFARVEWREDPAPGPVTGYFTSWEGSPAEHEPDRDWIPMGDDNQFVIDNAELAGLPEPWSKGTMIWPMLNRYRLEGAGQGTVFHTESQVMALSENGSSAITKHDNSAARLP